MEGSNLINPKSLNLDYFFLAIIFIDDFIKNNYHKINIKVSKIKKMSAHKKPSQKTLQNTENYTPLSM